MKTDIALDKLCELVPIIGQLRPKLKSDTEFKRIVLQLTSEEEGGDKMSFALNLAPILLKKYRSEIYEIMSILTDKSVEDIKEQSVVTTIGELKNILADEDIKTFFSQLLTTNA